MAERSGPADLRAPVRTGITPEWNEEPWKSLSRVAWANMVEAAFLFFSETEWRSYQINKKRHHFLGLPWWRSGWESACRCRGHGFEPWSGRIPRAAEQLGPWATTTEPARLEPVLCNKRGHDSERPAHRDEEWPPLAATGESPRTETKTQHSQK